jgi:hypothetical protein
MNEQVSFGISTLTNFILAPANPCTPQKRFELEAQNTLIFAEAFYTI